MEYCPSQFKADAVALYRSRPGASAAQVARVLGVYPATLLAWIKVAGQSGGSSGGGSGAQESAVSPMGAENRALRRTVAELEEEREVLRRAAKYFAGERNW